MAAANCSQAVASRCAKYVDDFRVPTLFTTRVLTGGRPERFSTKLEQIHARNFLKMAFEHALLANLKPFVKHLPNTCLFKNL
jgi:hypothetical protein